MMTLDISVCTFSAYDSEGFLGIQVGSLSEGSHGVTPGHHLSPLGLGARPVDPLQKGTIGSLAIRIPDGHVEFVLPCNDVRTEAALPNLAKGATCLFDTGTFKGHPFHFTATLDPIAQQMVLESHRVGGKIQTKNAEGALLELSGTTYTISGVTSVELGGQEQLAKFAALNTTLQAIQAALAAVGGAAALSADYPLKAAAANAVAAVAAFAGTGPTLITKGG